MYRKTEPFVTVVRRENYEDFSSFSPLKTRERIKENKSFILEAMRVGDNYTIQNLNVENEKLENLLPETKIKKDRQKIKKKIILAGACVLGYIFIKKLIEVEKKRIVKNQIKNAVWEDYYETR